jgi:ABC-2 type transport system ATP-binding protein
MAMIEIENLCKIYDKKQKRGLNGFSLTMHGNECVGLVGPNGAGKTTLIKALATLLPADSGTIRVGGYDVSTDAAAVRAVVGYLPDVPGLYQDLRIEEFLEFFADAFRLKEPRRRAAIERALERSGLAARRHDFVEHLSLGWKQRLMLAKTLLHEPKTLLLDEPATGLDPLARITLREQLKQLHSEGVAVLISSHILSDLEDVCTRIVFIADGKNVTDATSSPAVPASAVLRCEIEYDGSAEAVENTVNAAPGVKILEKKPGLLRLEVAGSERDASALLQRLLTAGLTVKYFDARGAGLEERYRRAFQEHS